MIATVNWQYIILRWPAGGVYRVKRRADGPPPIPATGIDMVNGDYWNKAAPMNQTYNGDQYNFAFWSITGSDTLSPQQEAHIDTSRTASSSHAGPYETGGGQWVINAKAYYVRDFGSGPGDHGVFIDAFDIQAGDFMPDDFVDVNPDDTTLSLTANANDGYIDTTTQIAAGDAITIKARDNVNTVLTNRTFAYWLGVDSLLISGNPSTPATVGSPDPHDIVAHHNDIIYGFAFYNQSATKHTPVKVPGIYDPWWKIRTHGGLTPPGPNPEPWMLEAIAAFNISMLSETVSPKLKTAILSVALEQLNHSASSLKKEIGKGGK